VPVKPITKESAGPRVKKLQQGIRKILKGHGFDVWAKAVIVDGKPGAMTFKMARLAGSMQGLSEAQLRHIREGKILRHAEEILIHEKKRSPEMVKRAKKRDPRFDKIRHHILHPPDDPDHISTFEGVAVPAWTVGKDAGPNGSHVNWLQKIRDAGWNGIVVSGARTAEHSEELCFGMCGQPSCPGTCAGRSSNHVVDAGYPDGALDVSEYTVFAQKAREVGAPLINALGAADPVHFSPSGH
jgi:hypothetical protein